MCGIVAYVGSREAAPILLDGLKRLEYRGYDSAGIAVLSGDHFEIRRDVGKLNNLISKVSASPVHGTVGIGHTRWATHGEPSERNAHPHTSASGEVVVVHNGIVENFIPLKEELQAEGVTFTSDTDTEVIVHLVDRYLQAGFPFTEAARRAIAHLRGAHGIVLLSLREPGTIVAARVGHAGGVVVGQGQGEMFIASDMPALLEHTRQMAFLDPGQMVVVTRDGFRASTLEGQPLDLPLQSVSWDPVAAEKGNYKHFMQKEIHEQVRSIGDTIAGRVDFERGRVMLPDLGLTPDYAKRIRRIVLTACGTAAHAGMVGRLLIERLAHIPAEVEIASEFRYRDPILDPDTVVIAISQSGETADTLAAMEEARRKGARLWSIVNVIGSQAMRMADGFISMQSGPEIGVASTKAFTAPLVDLYLLALHLAELRGTLSDDERRARVSELRRLPRLVGECLARESDVEQVAVALQHMEHCLYLGRGINMPIAYEGALKLKEISYIHAEGYPAGEMKHGPIALIEPSMPVVALAPRDPWYEKMLSQVEQAKARGGVVMAVVTDGDSLMPSKADHTLFVPEVSWMLSPVLTVIPLQMLAYHIAVLRGCDVDQPRNLAKSVTVE
ncbi:MAG TPA: glutamine--fructose-6-phosphate transaminase (isomerizing) [Anaerolineales bacterium]|nr:glutamine--fructose-6-phosphate transaminase (isomerizing) [Anaerolineales bacterium]